MVANRGRAMMGCKTLASGIGFLVSFLFVLSDSNAVEQTRFTIGFVTPESVRIKLINGKPAEEKPGWFVEWSRRAGKLCNIEIDYVQMPWSRQMKEVADGTLSAALNSSYKEERTKFGVYPMLSGKPDKSRSYLNYTYWLYFNISSVDDDLTERSILQGRSVVTERGASIVDGLKESGAEVYEMAKYETMLRMVEKERVDAALAVGVVVDPIIKSNVDYRIKIRKASVPYLEKIGYVMFSKKLYEKNPESIECFWTKSAELKATDWFKTMKSSYD